ncbi:hypothetical protein [Variovorax soli]|uniref:Uncharacterized protein n=1 Tax=Variovorax soli TaxID=376815 RepID=A0ABU1N7R1_9BURK|nr:hypothetical protein [Variovorax soli]MDR6534492.1 hypothetical protein [Variovorax soli]
MSTWKMPPQGPPNYRILQREGCTIVYGHMPLGSWLRLLRQASDLHVLHADVARMLGATAVLGPPEGLARLREQEAAAATGRVRAQLGRAARRLDAQAVRWLAAGEQGLSSLALFTLLTGVRPPHYGGAALDLPGNAQQFRRCRLLVEQVPSLQPALRQLARRVADPELVSWAALAETWKDLCAQMDHEWPAWRTQPGRAPGVNAMLACFHEVETDRAVLQASRTTASLPLPYGVPDRTPRRGGGRWLM